MKLPEIYAQSLYALLYEKDGEEARRIADRFVVFLKKRGYISLLPRIISAYGRIMEKKMQERALLACARASDAEEAKAKIEALLGGTHAVAVLVDDKLIGGYVFRKGETLVDASYKTALLTLYKNVIHN